ncbi:HNH endonuclease [Microbulbifer sp. CAU 1566]|uniref:HNH endonuclease n=1 Tax=Microbulbifer sp. CAU 1566 TaxID=2933269 RepID=UPI0020051549|nr:HNH endonuclease [Microbulbifer sp. CAU 1566]MCK7595816.1 HNH endonuclease [Microbulbifer sp. CAU 1566]
MTKLTLTPQMPNRFNTPALKAIKSIGEDYYEVSAGKQWIRISITPRNSIYFCPSKNNTVIVNIEGNAIKTHFDNAVFHWGKPYYRYFDKKIKKEYLKWRIDSDEFYSTVKLMIDGVQSYDSDLELISAIDSISNDKNLLNYEKQELTKQRIGHSSFAKKVKERAGNACLINPEIKRNLIASHIKPWSEAITNEKVDIDNGLCLSPNYDGLFEDGIISFKDDGTIIISRLSEAEKKAYALTGSEKIKLAPEQKKYLAWHRENKLVQNN